VLSRLPVVVQQKHVGKLRDVSFNVGMVRLNQSYEHAASRYFAQALQDFDRYADSLGSLTDAHIPDAVQTLLHAALLLWDDSLRLLAATRDAQWSE
jgi:hypothetical protein